MVQLNCTPPSASTIRTGFNSLYLISRQFIVALGRLILISGRSGTVGDLLKSDILSQTLDFVFELGIFLVNNCYDTALMHMNV